MKLGAVPNGFTKFWIDRFPRLISHSYHSLESCSNEHVFNAYYPTEYVFTKPTYFFELTEDFRPTFDAGNKSRDSPKRYNKEYRYKSMDYPNFVMDRNRTSRKGSYNFHRILTTGFQQNLKLGNSSNEITRNTEDNFRATDNKQSENMDDTLDAKIIETEAHAIEHLDDVNSVKMTKSEENTSTVDRQSKKSAAKTRMKSDSSSSNDLFDDVDDEGFTKVKYRGHQKKQKPDNHNENINWIVPTRDSK